MLHGHVKKYIEGEMNVKPTDKDPWFFDHYDPNDLEQGTATQHEVI